MPGGSKALKNRFSSLEVKVYNRVGGSEPVGLC